MSNVAENTSTIAAAIHECAHPITTLQLHDPLDDLESLHDSLSGARVFALGYPLTATEISLAANRLVRFLVERCGVRGIVLEDTPQTGRSVNDYVQHGGDLNSVLADVWTGGPYVAELFEWLHRWSQDHPRQRLHVIGADVSSTVHDTDSAVAETIMQWHTDAGQPAVYLGGLAHTVGSHPVTSSFPPSQHSPHLGRSAGSLLREQLGRQFRTIALTLHHGIGDEPIPAPPADFIEHTLAQTGLDHYAVDLQELAEHSPAAREWLDANAKTRVIGPFYDPQRDAEYHMRGGPLKRWFDLIVHVRRGTTSAIPGADLASAEQPTRAMHTQ